MHPEPSQDTVTPEQRSAAADAVEHALWLDEPDAIEAAETQFRAAGTVGLDTEFVRERTFYARPGMVQLSNGAQIWLLDAVALPRSEALGRLLADRDTVKVLHSVGEDLEVLRDVGGCLPDPLFDTQTAAALLGMPLQMRYEHLVEQLLGVELSGGKARNDWCKRPLSKELLHYAAEDVIWLPAVKEHLEARLEDAGRMEWHREDCRRLLERASSDNRVPPLSRVKGAGQLDTPDLARLDALASWRESMARQKDLPRRFVLGDETLIDLARTGGISLREHLSQILPGRHYKRYGDSLEQVLSEADVEGFHRPDWIDPLSPEQRGQVKALQNCVRTVAEELAIEPAVIASKRELIRLVRGERPEWLDGWRGQVLAGRLEPASVNISPR